MFTLPEYWWLLALALAPQAAFLAVLAISKGSGTRTDAPRGPVPGWAVGLLCLGSLVGIVYGIVQHDAVFVLGQACVVIIAFVRNRHAAREREERK